MRIIAVLSDEAANQSVESIVRALCLKHELRAFATDDGATGALGDLCAPVRRLADMNQADVEWADIVFCPTRALPQLGGVPKYVFSFCDAQPRFWLESGADFVFTSFDVEPSASPCFASMPIGRSDGAEARAAEVIEYIFESYISKSRYPDAKSYRYDDYKFELSDKAHITMDDLLCSRRVCPDIEASQCDYILKHADSFKGDIDSAYLYYAMYKSGRYGELMRLYKGSEAPHDALSYFAGLIYCEIDQSSAAIDCLKRAIDASLARDCRKYIVDSYELLSDAFQRMLFHMAQQNDMEGLVKYARLYTSFIAKYPRLSPPCGDPNALAKIVTCLQNESCAEEALAIGELLRSAQKQAPQKNAGITKRIRKSRKVFIGKVKRRLRSYWYDVKRYTKRYDEQDKAVLSYMGAHKDEACFIIGNGPSLTARDLERIKAKGYACFASNKIFKIFGQTSWRPDYFGCIDRDVFRQNLYEILTEVSCPVFLHAGMKQRVESYELAMSQKLDNVRYLRYVFRRGDESFYPQAAIVVSGGTVTFTLMELAWMMGFRKMYLIGCDHSYGAYKGIDRSAATLTADENTSKDYFSKDYMRPGEIMRVGDLDKATRGYISARRYIEAHGGEVYNATRGGMLEVFKRADLDELLK